jgi:hypothetical protein
MGVKITTVETGIDVHLTGIFYGLPGVGKTHILGTAQKCEATSPILVLDVDKGMATLSGSGIKVVRPSSFDEIQDIYNYLRFDNTTYRSVGIDSVTVTQQDLSMGEIIGIIEEAGAYTNLANHTPSTQYDWLSSGEQMKRTVSAFRDLAYLKDKKHRIHVFFTALEKTDDKRNIVCPSLPGVLGPEIGAKVDILGRMTLRPVHKEGGRTIDKYYMELKQHDEDGYKYLAKVRAPENVSVPRGMYDPTIQKLLDLWTSISNQGV